VIVGDDAIRPHHERRTYTESDGGARRQQALSA
jgi:hypothetical protein